MKLFFYGIVTGMILLTGLACTVLFFSSADSPGRHAVSQPLVFESPLFVRFPHLCSGQKPSQASGGKVVPLSHKDSFIESELKVSPVEHEPVVVSNVEQDWSLLMEQQISQAFSEHRYLAQFQLFSISCVSNQCDIEILQPDQDVNDAALTILFALRELGIYQEQEMDFKRGRRREDGSLLLSITRHHSKVMQTEE